MTTILQGLGTDWWLTSGMICLITGLFWLIGLFAVGTVHDARTNTEIERREKQRLINHIIGQMVEFNNCEILEDLEWQLHTALYEYRQLC